MKILRLRFKNINSFYGKPYAIDFTARPLSECGLFIISGPTGAGKSTILDVITLALYNEVPRFGRQVSKGEIDKLGSVVNSRAAEEPKCEAFAEVEYEVRTGRYRAVWSISKNRNGNWNNYQMEIANLPEETLLEVKNLTDFPKKNAELIGLNFDQFVKSIILAQGSFAEFLKADRNTRTKLLEDITGTHIYRQLGVMAFLRYRDSGNLISLKEAELKGVLLKSDEELTELAAQEVARKAEQEAAEKEVIKWDKEKNLSADQIRLRRDAQRIDSEKVKLNREKEAFKEYREQLAAHESVSHLVAPMTSFRESQKRFGRINDEIKVRKDQSVRLQNEETELLESLSGVIGKKIAPAEFLMAIDNFEVEILEFESKIKEQRAHAAPVDKSVRAEIVATGYSWLKELSITNYEGSLRAISGLRSDFEKVVSSYPEDFNASDRLKSLDMDLETLSELKSELQNRDRLAEEGKKFRDELIKVAESEKKIQPALESISGKLVFVKKNLEEKNEQLIRELASGQMDEQRNHLRKGEPCPLCGSLDHPYLVHYVNYASALAKELQILKAEQGEMELQEKKLSLELEGGKRAVKELNERLVALRSEYKRVDAEIKQIVLKMEVGEKATVLDIQEKIRTIQEEKAGIDGWIKGKDQLRIVARLNEAFIELIEVRNEVRRLEQERKQRYAGNQIQQDAREFRSKWENIGTVTIENSKQLKLREAESEVIRAEIDLKMGELNRELEVLGLPSLDEAERRILPNERFRELRSDADRIRNLDQELNLMAAENARMLSEKNLERNFPDILHEEVERQAASARVLLSGILQEIASVQTILRTENENRERFGVIQNALVQLQTEHRKWELLKQYIGDATGNEFSSFAQSLTLQNLIGLANIRLSKLSDRYLLEKPRNDSDGLYVLDTYHGNQARAVSTLSGGETFTVSLALALALSDLASRNVRIESLFIDEGFGTLDAETLESAVAILERLQEESSKTVGVISHRPEMKERIPVQIQVEKGNDGASSIKIVG